jgi:hypothetical protein
MEYLGFTETIKFSRKALKLLEDEGIAELEIFLCKYPTDGVVVPASGGIRKMRWSSSGKGKRGGARVIYYFAVSKDRIFLLDIYPKNEKSDLTRDELNILQTTVKEWLSKI